MPSSSGLASIRPEGGRHDFRGEKKSDQTLFFKKFIPP